MQKAILVGPCAESRSRKLSYNDDTVVIFIDAGLKYQKTQFKKTTHWLSVGDQDSGTFKPQIKLKKNKNESDLFHALRLLPKNISLVETYGLFPELKNEGRFDHRLFNLGELYRLSQNTGLTFLLNDHQVLLPAGEHKLDIKGEFSLISFMPTKIKITGKVKYPLKKPTLVDMFSSRTLSNKGSGRMILQNNHPLLLYTFRALKEDWRFLYNISR